MIKALVMALISKEEKQTMRAVRAVKTVFVLASMLISFLVFSAPILLAIADALLPAALLSATLPSSSLSDLLLLLDYHFTLSLADIPLVSLARSAFIILVYSLCNGPRLSRGPYLGITTVCSLSSLVFLSLKASYFFNSVTSSSSSSLSQVPSASRASSSYVRTLEVALFVCSAALAVGHTVVAYRISCRERRKLLVYKIDIEALWTEWPKAEFIKSFHSRHGKAYLFAKVVNVFTGDVEERLIMTGAHTVADIFCVGCGSLVGWKYETAHEKVQKYKEGKSVLERFKLLGPDGTHYRISHEVHIGSSDADDV